MADQKQQQIDDAELERLTRPPEPQKQQQVESVRPQRPQQRDVDRPVRAQKEQPKQETEIERLARAQKEKTKVSGCFLIGPEGHYRLRRLYAPGEKIRIENEVPSPTWTPYDPTEPAKVELPPVAPKAGDPANTAI